MKAVNDLLREADPLNEDPGLSDVEVRVMRRAVVEAANERQAAGFFAYQPLAVGAVLVLMIAAGITTGRHLPSSRNSVSRPSSAPTVAEERRQLQFATPGGTRIIWTFDPEFHP
jgi:hypothetical protein